MKKTIGFRRHPAFLGAARVTGLTIVAVGLLACLVCLWNASSHLALDGLTAITSDSSKAITIVVGILAVVIGSIATKAYTRALMRLIRSIVGTFKHLDTRETRVISALPPLRSEDRDLARIYGDPAVRDALSALPEAASKDEKIALLEQLEPNQFKILSREQRALHEAEHAVVAHALGQIVISANIKISGDTGGMIIFRSRKLTPEDRLRIRIAISVAPVASALRAGDLDGHSNDLFKATRDAQALSLLLATSSRNTAAQQSVDSMIRSAAVIAEDILDLQRNAVEEIKEQLLEHEHLEGREVARIITQLTPLSPGR
ncbi:hypothetical protein [Arthrobacter bambusae]|uniref:Peptidase M41 domain-containing protein n=1 Tax=Arthrobacter bambusae TaxID=1338426 RepID=A0AAW8D645_9MICC|nr:hypothetical protein [Arthrobacter bambusae]MDP9903170.1 hypothetical protein [Arthrobacter bambusae]MDQ0128836.1 hypothetical protein [Arthrobacter bambusae]MDQ0180177.1 hypothetical protein [Arthrobacter bambusae]